MPTRFIRMVALAILALAASTVTSHAEGWKIYAADGKGNFGWSARPVDPNSHISIPSREALNGCGSAECKVVMSLTAQCMAFAESRTGGYWYGHAAGMQINFVIQDALKFCGQPTCKIIHTFCS